MDSVNNTPQILENVPQLLENIASLLNQYEGFINDFNSLIITNKLGVTMTSYEGIMVDCPIHVPDADLEKFKLRIKVLDGVIKERELDIASQLDQISSLKNTESFKIGDLTNRFKTLKEKYPF